MDRIEIKPFVTCIVIQLGIFESVIVDERHFKDLEDAARFRETVAAEYLVVIATV